MHKNKTHFTFKLNLLVKEYLLLMMQGLFKDRCRSSLLSPTSAILHTKYMMWKRQTLCLIDGNQTPLFLSVNNVHYNLSLVQSLVCTLLKERNEIRTYKFEKSRQNCAIEGLAGKLKGFSFQFWVQRREVSKLSFSTFHWRVNGKMHWKTLKMLKFKVS